MSSHNSATIVGHLGQDVELRFTQSNTPVANISVATTEKFKSNGEWKEQTTWHNVVLWGRKAEVAEEYLRKGSQVLIVGPIQKRTYEDKDGNERTSTEIKALKMTMLDSKGDSAKPAPAKATASPNDVDEIDDDLPF